MKSSFKQAKSQNSSEFKRDTGVSLEKFYYNSQSCKKSFKNSV